MLITMPHGNAQIILTVGVPIFSAPVSRATIQPHVLLVKTDPSFARVVRAPLWLTGFLRLVVQRLELRARDRVLVHPRNTIALEGYNTLRPQVTSLVPPPCKLHIRPFALLEMRVMGESLSPVPAMRTKI